MRAKEPSDLAPFAVGEKRPARQLNALSQQPRDNKGFKEPRIHLSVNNRRNFKSPDKIFLEDQSKGTIRVFRMVKDEETFPEIYADPQFQLINLNIY